MGEKMNLRKSARGQAMPPETVPITRDAFENKENTVVRWLGGAGIMLNSRGTALMIDPLLEGFDMDLLINMPILPNAVPKVDAVLVTHIDNDHFSRPTCKNLLSVCASYHAPQYVAEEMRKEGIPGTGHDIHESFSVNNVKITLTPADHDWQNDVPEFQYRHWEKRDYCGFWLETTDGIVWTPGDSRLLEEQLHMPEPDVILFDFSDNEYHITFEGAVKLANTYPHAELICIISDPERIHAPAPGEAFTVTKKN